jgi:hypothetical protein
MSRRDIVVNTLLGLFLLLVFALPVVLAVVAGAYVFAAVDRSVRHFLPGTAHPESVAFLCLFSLASLVYGIGHLRRHRWMSAFLFFAMFPMILSVWFAKVHSSFALDRSFWMFSLFPILAISKDFPPTRSQFLVGASTITTVVAINTGLLGSGPIARIAADCVLTGLFIWFVIYVRQSWSSKNPGSEAPLSPSRT